MKLEVHERLAILNILPSEGDYAALKTIRRNKEGISFSPDEIKLFEFNEQVMPSGKVKTTWNSQKAAENIKDVPLDEYTTNVIRDALQDMNKKHKLTDEYFSLYEKFIIMYT